MRDLEATVQRLGNLVLNVSALAERVDARSAGSPEEARQRQERVAVLRQAARTGQSALDRLTAHLLRERVEPSATTLDLTERDRRAAGDG